MRRTTDDKHTLRFKFDLEDVDAMRVTYTQGDEIILEKELDDIETEGNVAVVSLSPEETALFSDGIAEVQAKMEIKGKVVATKVYKVAVRRILNPADLTEVDNG